MKTLLILTLLATLSGCATTRYSTVHCLTPAELAKLKADKPGKVHDQLNGSADHDIKPVGARLVRMEAYADGLITILGGCTDAQVGETR